MEEQTEIGMVRPWLLVILAVVVLAGIGFFNWNYLQNRKTDNIASINSTLATPMPDTSIVVPTAIQAVSPSPISTADWKTFTNTKYGFSFKYPNDWGVVEGSEIGVINLAGSTKEGELNPDQTKIVIYQTTIDSVGNLNDYVVNQYEKIVSESNIIVGGFSAKKFVSQPQIMGTKTTEVFVLKNNFYYQIICMENSDKLDSILSTFQFTK